MNLVKSINQYNGDNVFFCESIKNNIMTDGRFIRIIYSNNLFTLNCIYIHITLHDHTITKYFNKYKCDFDINLHKNEILKIKNIEDELLKKVNIINKTPQFKIAEKLMNGNIKIFADNIDRISNTFLLKISGIWETEHHYGVTYKFIHTE